MFDPAPGSKRMPRSKKCCFYDGAPSAAASSSSTSGSSSSSGASPAAVQHQYYLERENMERQYRSDLERAIKKSKKQEQKHKYY